MVKKSVLNRLERCHRIYEQLYQDPLMPVYEIARNADLSRNTVSKYLQEMLDETMLLGPYLRMKVTPTYKEYVYLANFSDPKRNFTALSCFPSVLDVVHTFGDWTTLLVTNQPLDITKMYGLQDLVLSECKYSTITPKTEFTSWKAALSKASEILEDPGPPSRLKREVAPPLDWGEDQWKIYSIFNQNMRKTVVTSVQKVLVRFETYVKWREDLNTHCSMHTGFYPRPYSQYTGHWFLLSSLYESLLVEVFSCLPVTPCIVETEHHLLVFVHTISSSALKRLADLIIDMKSGGLVEDVRYGLVLREAHPPIDFSPFIKKEEKDHGNKEERRTSPDRDTGAPHHGPC
ncbi:MAG: winged helix-turn-helix domain-containing protein [Theionarchaea archaeon]|nr:winged helix-turn-helix domain-containing protein [Theionarchaea archaeon]